MPPPLHEAGRLGISYRPAGDADLPFVATVYASTRIEEIRQAGWTEEEERRFLVHQFEAQHRHYQAHYHDAEWLVIEREGVPIGRLYIEEWTREFRIIDIALLPGHRGAGSGSAILADILFMARAAGKLVSIHVEQNNPAMHLYERLGFAKIDEHGIYHLMEWDPNGTPGSNQGIS